MEITIERLIARLNELRIKHKKNNDNFHAINNMLTRLVVYQHPRLKIRKDLDHKKQRTMTDAIALIKELA